MRTIKIFISLIAFCLISTSGFAQYCDLKINDPNNSGNQSYYYVVELYDFAVSTTTPVETQSGTDTWVSSGSVNSIWFSTYAPDNNSLYFRGYARNTSNQRWDLQWTSVFDSDDYYNGVSLTLNIP